MVKLLHNPLEAMDRVPQDQPRATAPTQRIARRTVQVSIQDWGIGIPSDRPERIFEPRLSTKAAGMGMGLPIRRSIVERHGGRSSVAAAPGGGTVVSFTLPVHHARQAR